jgi:hypothetical protein
MHERKTVAQAAILHVWNRYFSFGLKRLFLSGFHDKRPDSTQRWRAVSPRHWRQISDVSKVSTHRPVFTDVDL